MLTLGPNASRLGEPRDAVPADDPSEMSILIVDDNLGDARLIEFTLRDIRSVAFSVSHVKTVNEAVNRLGVDRFDIIFLDLSLPDAVGLAGLQEIALAAPSTAIIMHTSFDDERIADSALNMGAQDYLVKGEANGRTLLRSIRYAIERKRSAERLAQLAQFDALTGLANRALFHDRIGRAILRSRRDDRPMALLFIDIDHFKAINDTHGHIRADKVLQEVARRLKACVRGSDTVARLAGDEFTVILEAIDDPAFTSIAAAKLLEEVARPVIVDDHAIHLTVSIGGAVFPDAANDVESLLRNADIAMYDSKRAGRNTFRVYDPGIVSRISEAVRIEKQLQRAIDLNEFQVHFQPRFCVRTGAVLGAEALLRWRNAELGDVEPAAFIPIAEKSGLIVPIGEYVLREACRHAVDWSDVGFEHFKIAVNVSGCQLRHAGFVASVRRVLEETGIDPRRLEIELTESVFIADMEEGSVVLGHLKDLGVGIAVDDFGTGYSSLAYLRRFPISAVKIDWTFVHDIDNPNDASIVQAIIALGHSLNLTVVAEGVETASQMAFLRDRGCDSAQGFLLSPALPPELFVRKLYAWRAGAALGH